MVLMKFTAYNGQGQRKYLNAAEGDRFLNRCGKIMPQEEAAFCKTLYFTGCRVSEALSLSPESIDGEEQTLRIFTLKKREKEVVRRVPIPDQLFEDLRDMDLGSERLWSFSRSTAWRIVKAAMCIAEIDGIHACPKGLRHGFGVRCALASIPVTKIQTWMGHSNVETTAIYLNVRGEEDRELMARTWPQ